ncbi:MAG: ATP-binding cassette domain-containing protein [Treponema sp.]|jgi:ABC-type sugar transport system ATPase subunit|nr:ATP-binding cassette domain-containing protein [Treponema sp.]
MDSGIFLPAKGISKQYGQVTVLDRVTADLYRGEAHAIVGENGAGKSTICKAIAGAIRPSSGTFTVGRKTISGWTPQDAKKADISMVYQEFNLIPEMPVYENLFIGKEIHTSIFVDKKAMIAESERIFSEMGVSVNAQTKLKTLSVAYCQLVEIAKALLDISSLLILDEPAATLTNNEASILFNVLKKLKSVSFTLQRGEILGLVGSGRTETARAVFGADKIDSGKIFINGKEVHVKSPSDTIKHGLALIPEDRKRDGLMLILSIMHNISVVVIKSRRLLAIKSLSLNKSAFLPIKK